MKDNHSKLAFVTSFYTDSEYSSGGVKLNTLLLKELVAQGFQIDLFTNYIINNKLNLFENICSFSSIENSRDKYSAILSDKGCTVSNITYIHDHSYKFRIKTMYNKFSYFLYKIFCYKKHKKRLNEFYATKMNLDKTDVVIVSSNILKKDMIENYEINEKRIVVIPPPMENYDTVKNSKNDIFTFGISAVGFERKGGYILLKAIRKLKKYNKNFRVLIIYKNKNLFVKLLIKLYGIEKYCKFSDYYTNMGDFYNQLDCLLMPSLLEPFGMVATEAMGTGCPVITNLSCGASDYIKDDFNSFLYEEPLDSKALSDCMLKIIDLDKDKYDILSKNAKESVKNLKVEDFTYKYTKILKTSVSDLTKFK